MWFSLFSSFADGRLDIRRAAVAVRRTRLGQIGMSASAAPSRVRRRPAARPAVNSAPIAISNDGRGAVATPSAPHSADCVRPGHGVGWPHRRRLVVCQQGRDSSTAPSHWRPGPRARSCSSPRKCKIALKPPTASKASFRTIGRAGQETEDRWSGQRWVVAQRTVGKGRRHRILRRLDGHTTVRAASSATVGCLSKTVSRRSSAHRASHQESSSQNATIRSTGSARRRHCGRSAPRLSERVISFSRPPDRADSRAITATESSREALSTTAIGHTVVSSSRLNGCGEFGSAVAASDHERGAWLHRHDWRHYPADAAPNRCSPPIRRPPSAGPSAVACVGHRRWRLSR